MLVIKEIYTELIGRKVLLLRMGGELGIKSRRTRRRMVNTLQRNLRNLFKEKKQEVSLFEYGDRLILQSNDKNTLDKLAYQISILISGISSVSPVLVVNSSEEEIIEKGVLEAKKIIPPNSSYAVRARREGKHPFTSMSIAARLGSAIGTSGIQDLKVNLSNPDFTILLDIRNELTFIYSEVIYGIDGLPSQTQGTAVAIFRPSLNSILAAWLMKKRGVKIIPLFFKTGKKSESIFISFIEENFSSIRSFIDMDSFFSFFKNEPELCFYCQAYCEIISQNMAKKFGNLTFVSPTCFNYNDENITIDALKVLEERAHLSCLRPIQFGFLGEKPDLTTLDKQACCPLREKVVITVNDDLDERKLHVFLKDSNELENH